MSDNKPDNEIRTILDCCSKGDCENCNREWSYNNQWDCMRHIMRLASNLINRLQAKVDRFEKRQKPTAASGYKIENGKVVFFVDMLGSYSYEYKDLDEVVKTLNELLKECYSKDEIVCALKCKTEELKTAKAEAYKEFAEEVFKLFPADKPNTVISRVTVKHILKELVGDDK